MDAEGRTTTLLNAPAECVCKWQLIGLADRHSADSLPSGSYSRPKYMRYKLI